MRPRFASSPSILTGRSLSVDQWSWITQVRAVLCLGAAVLLFSSRLLGDSGLEHWSPLVHCTESEFQKLTRQQEWLKARECLENGDFLSGLEQLELKALCDLHLSGRQAALETLKQEARLFSLELRSKLKQTQHVIARQFLSETSLQLFEDAMTLLLHRKFPLSHEKFEKALQEDPDNVETLFRLGQVTYLEGQLAQSHSYFKRALELDASPELKLWLTRVLFLQNRESATSELTESFKEVWESLGHELSLVWYAKALKGGAPEKAISVLAEDALKHSDHFYSLLEWARLVQKRTLEDPRQRWRIQGLIKRALFQIKLKSPFSVSGSALLEDLSFLEGQDLGSLSSQLKALLHPS